MLMSSTWFWWCAKVGLFKMWIMFKCE